MSLLSDLWKDQNGIWEENTPQQGEHPFGVLLLC